MWRLATCFLLKVSIGFLAFGKPLWSTWLKVNQPLYLRPKRWSQLSKARNAWTNQQQWSTSFIGSTKRQIHEEWKIARSPFNWHHFKCPSSLHHGQSLHTWRRGEMTYGWITSLGIFSQSRSRSLEAATYGVRRMITTKIQAQIYLTPVD